MPDIPPETPLTEEQKRLGADAAHLIYQAIRVKVGVTRAYTAAVMWDELMNKHTRMFVPTLIRPVQVYTVRQVRTIAAQRLQDAQDGVVVDELAVRAVEQPPA